MNNIIYNKIKFILVFSFFNFSALAINDVGGPPSPQADDETRELARTYSNFCSVHRNNNNIRDFETAYEEFEESIFFPILQSSSDPTDPNRHNPRVFLKRARKTFEKIQEAINDNQTSGMLRILLEKDIEPELNHRIDLARLDQNIFQGVGRRGSMAINANIPLQQVLNLLTGRVFQINNEDGECVSTSSGTMVHWNNNQMSTLNNNNNLLLTSILTCAHAINSDDDRSDFYFVQSANLNLTTGFPSGVNNLAELLAFLQGNPHSFKIGNFTIRNRNNNTLETINLTMAHPQYFQNEDIIIGNINLRPLQVIPTYNINYNILFQNNLPPIQSKYYALGYPGCDHYDPTPFVNHPQFNLIDNEGRSPLFITRSINTAITQLTNNNGIINHSSPTAQGMSGGPLFYLTPGALNIFGIITGGEGDNERGCCWF